MKAGIVGLPNVGKSTLFNCLTNGKAQSANFPFCTIDPNFGAVTIPDERLNKLVELVKPEKTIPNSVEIVDIAGLVKGASKGEGLGNQFLSNIRETNAIIHVLRCYENDNITHVEGSVDPYRDKEIIDFELQIKDLETIIYSGTKLNLRYIIDDLFDDESHDELLDFFNDLESDDIQIVLDEFEDEYEEEDLKLFRLYHYCEIGF